MNARPTNLFEELMSRVAAADVTAIVIISILAIVGIVAIICLTAYRVHKNRLEDQLKRELLDRGMGAEEIAMVVSAGRASRPHKQ